MIARAPPHAPVGGFGERQRARARRDAREASTGVAYRARPAAADPERAVLLAVERRDRVGIEAVSVVLVEEDEVLAVEADEA